MTDEQRIAAYYDGLVERYGHDPRAADASSDASLELRHRVLGDVCDLNGKDVLEIGCGFGALGARLVERYPSVRYRGVDVSERMIGLGRSVHPGLDLRQAALDDLTEADAAEVVLAQGIFYLLGDEAEQKSERMIAQMLGLAREAVAFTTMSSWAPTHAAGEYFADPVRLLAYCRTLTSRLTLRHDYHAADVALYLYREPTR